MRYGNTPAHLTSPQTRMAQQGRATKTSGHRLTVIDVRDNWILPAQNESQYQGVAGARTYSVTSVNKVAVSLCKGRTRHIPDVVLVVHERANLLDCKFHHDA